MIDVEPRIEKVSLASIGISNENVRKSDRESDIDELAESILEVGLLQPLSVMKRGDGFELIVGQRRFLAIQQLQALGKWYGGDLVEARVYEGLTREERTILSLTENLERKPLSVKDTIVAVGFLYSKYKDAKKVAEKLGFSQTAKVYRFLQLAKLPAALKLMVERKEISQTDALRAMTAAGNNPEKAVEIAKYFPRLRTDQKLKLVSMGTAEPMATATDLYRRASRAEPEFKIVIVLPQNQYNRLRSVSNSLRMDVESTATRAVLEWLSDQAK